MFKPRNYMAIAALAVVTLAATRVLAVAPTPVPTSCSSTVGSLFGTLAVTCPAGCHNDTTGAVVGSNLYRADSMFCASAIHAGLADNATGGTVMAWWPDAVQVNILWTEFINTTAHGITSAYGAKAQSRRMFTSLSPYDACSAARQCGICSTVPGCIWCTTPTVGDSGVGICIRGNQTTGPAYGSCTLGAEPFAVIPQYVNSYDTSGNWPQNLRQCYNDPCLGKTKYTCNNADRCGWCNTANGGAGRCESGGYYSGDSGCSGTAWVWTVCMDYGAAECRGYPNCGMCMGDGANGDHCMAATRGDSGTENVAPLAANGCAAGQWLPPAAIYVKPECERYDLSGQPNMQLVNNSGTNTCLSCLDFGCEWCPALNSCGGRCSETVNNKRFCPGYEIPLATDTIVITAILGALQVGIIIGLHFWLRQNGPYKTANAGLYTINEHSVLGIFFLHPSNPFTRGRRMYVLFIAIGLQLTMTYIILSSSGMNDILAAVVSGLLMLVCQMPIKALMKYTGRLAADSNRSDCMLGMAYGLSCVLSIPFIVIMIILVTVVLQAKNLEYTFEQVMFTWTSSCVLSWAAEFVKLPFMFAACSSDEALFPLDAENTLCCCGGGSGSSDGATKDGQASTTPVKSAIVRQNYRV